MGKGVGRGVGGGAGGGRTKDPQGGRGNRGKKCPEAALRNRKDLVGRFRDEKG